MESSHSGETIEREDTTESFTAGRSDSQTVQQTIEEETEKTIEEGPIIEEVEKVTEIVRERTEGEADESEQTQDQASRKFQLKSKISYFFLFVFNETTTVDFITTFKNAEKSLLFQRAEMIEEVDLPEANAMLSRQSSTSGESDATYTMEKRDGNLKWPENLI